MAFFRVSVELRDAPFWVFRKFSKILKSTSENMRDGQKRDFF